LRQFNIINTYIIKKQIKDMYVMVEDKIITTFKENLPLYYTDNNVSTLLNKQLYNGV